MSDADKDFEGWLATGSFLDSLNASITKLSDAVDRNTAVAQSLDKRLVALEMKDTQRDLDAIRLAAEASRAKDELEALRKRTFSAGVKDWSNHVGDWLTKQKDNKIVLVLGTAVAVYFVPDMRSLVVQLFQALSGK